MCWVLICLFFIISIADLCVAILFQHVKTMGGFFGRPGNGAPLEPRHVDFAKKQKRKYI